MLFCRLANSRSVSSASIAYCYKHGGGGEYDRSVEGVGRVSEWVRCGADDTVWSIE